MGNARCTQTITLSNDVPASARPTLMLCWRVGAQKSVYTVAIKADGRPAAKTSVALIDKEWARLG